MHTLLNSARFRAARRGMECSVTCDDLLDLLLVQEGRCFYSGVPMECRLPNSHWRMSLERFDNGRGYVLGNIALVAAEFNTPDNSRNRGADIVYGTAQWSRDKVEHVWGPT